MKVQGLLSKKVSNTKFTCAPVCSLLFWRESRLIVGAKLVVYLVLSNPRKDARRLNMCTTKFTWPGTQRLYTATNQCYNEIPVYSHFQKMSEKDRICLRSGLTQLWRHIWPGATSRFRLSTRICFVVPWLRGCLFGPRHSSATFNGEIF